jgi:N-methylhydantoinase B
MATADVARAVHPSGFWDGSTHAYIPSAEVKVAGGLRLHADAAQVDDPITFEVIRHSLWNINQEHGSVIKNLCVSPIMLETRDFQTGILTEDGELLFFGPYLQYMSGMLDVMARYILEKKGHLVADGDMWLQNDPWVGTAHQPDVGLLCPVFHEGELFCWVVNCAHQNDVGGTVPGSFCPNAIDIYYDPPLFPPFRIVRNDEIDEEVESIYRRQSRTPINLALDLRATIAGNHAARRRILGLIDKYGAATVKGVMRGILDASQAAFSSFMATIPDGSWSERCYQEVAVTGDRGAYRQQLTVHKEGDVLTFENEGTDPQVGAINLPFAGWRGGTLGALNVLLMADHMGAVGGAVRNLRFEPVPGTISCPDYGAAVSPAGVFATELAIAMANSVITKMLLCSSDLRLRSRALATTNAQWQIHIHAGTNQRGEFYVGPMLDTMIGATGASPYADGVFANGHMWIPEGRGPNVEAYERDWPMLYLYRREDPDSGGAGRFRGGNGGRVAYIAYKGDVAIGVYSSEGIPKTPGILGGLPASTGATVFIRATDVLERFRAGQMVDSVDELVGDRVQTQGKGLPLVLEHDAVAGYNWAGCAGYGDPLGREPGRVVEDVLAGAVSDQVARDEYGVVLRDAGLDIGATERRRRELRRARLLAAGVEREPAELGAAVPDGDLVIGADVWVDTSSREFRCAHCGGSLAPLADDPKAGLVVYEHAVADIGPRFTDPSLFVDTPIVWREYFCPGCGTRLSTEVAKPDDEPLAEFRLRLE